MSFLWGNYDQVGTLYNSQLQQWKISRVAIKKLGLMASKFPKRGKTRDLVATGFSFEFDWLT